MNSDLIVKKVTLFFFGTGLLVMCAVGSYNTFNVRANGIAALGKIVSFEKFIPYDPKNRLQPPKYKVELQYQDTAGNFQIQKAILSREEQDDYDAKLGTILPFWYVPETGQYSIGKEPPGLGWIIGPLVLLIPASLACFFFGIRIK